MSRDPLDERSEQLFLAARQEAAPEETRLRILAALQDQGQVPTALARARRRAPHSWPAPVPLTLAVAAAALVVLSVTLWREPSEPMSIAAETFAPSTNQAAEESSPEHPSALDGTAQDDAARDDAALEGTALEGTAVETTALETEAPQAPQLTTAPRPSNQRPSNQRPAVRAPATLEQELAGMQRARAALGRGAATVALAELEAFGRNSGWRQLSVEASLLRIEALAAAGRTEQARSQARRFVEQHPNNPLVDRAQKFATGQAADAAPSSVKTENRK